LEKDSTTSTFTVTSDGDKMQDLVKELKGAGLASGDDVKVEVKGGKIIVNGVELSAEVTSKYKTYLDDAKNVEMTIKTTEKKN